MEPSSDEERLNAEYRSQNGATRAAAHGGLERLIVLSYILAIGMPPLGLILGIALAFRTRAPRSRHGAWIILASIFAGLVWIAIITSGALTATNNSY